MNSKTTESILKSLRQYKVMLSLSDIGYKREKTQALFINYPVLHYQCSQKKKTFFVLKTKTHLFTPNTFIRQQKNWPTRWIPKKMHKKAHAITILRKLCSSSFWPYWLYPSEAGRKINWNFAMQVSEEHVIYKVACPTFTDTFCPRLVQKLAYTLELVLMYLMKGAFVILFVGGKFYT